MRIKIKEYIRFFRIFIGAMRKLNRPRNAKRSHWSESSQARTYHRLVEETDELLDALINKNKIDQVDECYDVINFALFMADNLQEKE